MPPPCALALLFALAVAPPARAADPVKVFVLAGQSNMQGHGHVEAHAERNGGRGSLAHLARDPGTAARFGQLLDADGAWVRRDDVWISLRGARELDGPLAPGFGARDDALGPELGFGHAVGDALDEPVLLVKVAWGGKSLAVDFRPPSAGGEVGPFYTQLVEHVRDVLAHAGELHPALAERELELAGFAWHQGWNDRIDQAFNEAYEENLTAFIHDIRRELGVPDLPFAIAETGMSGPDESHPRALSLMAAQAAVAEREEFRGNVAFVATRAFWRPADQSPSAQGYHWNENAETYWLIGEGLGRAMLQLVEARSE